MPSEPIIRREKSAFRALTDRTRALLPIWHRANMASMQVLFSRAWWLCWCLVLGVLLGQNSPAVAQPSLQQKTVGGKTYTVRLLIEENFANLDNWLVEMKSPRKMKVQDNILQWDARNSMGTMWNKTLVRGPSLIEYDVQNLNGKNNINAIFYGSIIKKEREILLETTHQRTGAYKEYHIFPNYIITYLSKDPSTDIRTWRIRFRKNPGFNLLSERFITKRVSSREWQHMTYIFGQNGSMNLYVDNHLVHTERDMNEPYRLGYHALRIGATHLKYKNFKIYRIVPSSPPDPITIRPPQRLHLIETTKGR